VPRFFDKSLPPPLAKHPFFAPRVELWQSAHQMTESIRRVFGGVQALVSLFMVEHRGVLTIVDTGQAHAASRTLKALRNAGHKPEDVRQIVLTHCHGDHTGALSLLREATGATIVAGAEDAPVIEGEAEYPGPVDGLFRAAYANLARFPRTPVDRVVSGKEELEGGLIAVPTPGHTAGHIAVVAPDLGAAFTGDLVWHLGPLRPSWRRLTQNPEQCEESIKEFAGLGVERILPSHGPDVSGDRLKDLARRL
jgi:glyoxylase-like metal-dependent hydrolase (beta-lactamase superfamily II)